MLDLKLASYVANRPYRESTETSGVVEGQGEIVGRDLNSGIWGSTWTGLVSIGIVSTVRGDGELGKGSIV